MGRGCAGGERVGVFLDGFFVLIFSRWFTAVRINFVQLSFCSPREWFSGTRCSFSRPQVLEVSSQ